LVGERSILGVRFHKDGSGQTNSLPAGFDDDNEDAQHSFLSIPLARSLHGFLDLYYAGDSEIRQELLDDLTSSNRMHV
jgi:hypothetical protein